MKKYLSILLGLLWLLTLSLGGVQAQDQTIVEIAASNDDFSTLVTAVEAAGLVDVLADPDAEWTVFAPTNAAFEALPEGVLDMLLADTELLTRVLTYHVVEGTVTSDMLTSMMAPSMEMTAPGAPLMGSELDVTVGDDGTVMVNDATVVTADILASNGVIHVIDSVLVPPEIAAMLEESMMMDGDMMMDATLFTSLNPAELADDAVVTLTGDLSEMTSTFDGFDGITSVESIKFASNGDAYITVDTGEDMGSILVVEGLGMADSMRVGMGTRMIGGTMAAGLVAPKGLDIIEDLDLVLVANFGATNIKGFSLSAEGDVEPTVFIDDFGGVSGSIWDVHYDAETDTLFVANTGGTLLLYAGFSEDLGASGPTSQIIPSDMDGNQISVNLHGVDYDAASDTVILSDVGLADDATDGQLFTISGVSMANGNVPVDLAIGGPESMLGNPVDVVWDGSGIYVAEKANDMVLYYADLLDTMGMMDGAATMSIEAPKAESVTLFHAGM
ncbi:MAG: hypothetical protein CL610_21445 [Anaerolineaceae bacterium]|nr:hypothetical protein [Anaerolineaceae bacterium]